MKYGKYQQDLRENPAAKEILKNLEVDAFDAAVSAKFDDEALTGAFGGGTMLKLQNSRPFITDFFVKDKNNKNCEFIK